MMSARGWPVSQRPATMRGVDRFDLVADERLALADLLEGLSAEQWFTPSLCEGWTVREVAAHVMVGPTTSVGEMARTMLRARGSFDRANQVLAQQRAQAPTHDLVALLRDRARSRFTPPLMDWRAPLTDLLVDRDDIAVPLGIASDRPVGTWDLALAFLVTPKARSAFLPGRLPPVALRSSETGWAFGDGPAVVGPSAALGTVVAGRRAQLGRLDGDGVAVLDGWLARSGR